MRSENLPKQVKSSIRRVIQNISDTESISCDRFLLTTHFETHDKLSSLEHYLVFFQK